MSDSASTILSPADNSNADEFRVFTPGPKDLERFESNREAFKKYAPSIFQKLDAIKSTATQLVVNNEGDFDIDFRGEKFFQGGSRKWAADRVENFENKPNVQRISASPIHSANLDDVANDTMYRLKKRVRLDNR